MKHKNKQTSQLKNLGKLPIWNLRDLYKSTNSKELSDDLHQLKIGTKRFEKMIEPIFSNTDQKISTGTENTTNDIADEIMKLNELYESGVLTKEEFDKAKKKILN